jgi:hypothetical protein
MILSLGLGEPSYVPDVLAGIPRDDVELDMVAFCQCYATDLLSWKVLLYFAGESTWVNPAVMAGELAEPISAVMAQLERMTQRNLLEERLLVTGPLYRLGPQRQLRRSVLRLRDASGYTEQPALVG